MHKITKGLFFGLCLFFLVKATAQDMTSANPEQKEMTEQEQECKWARDFMYFAFIKEQSYKAISNMGITIELPETYELLSPDTIFQTLSRTCSSTTATEEQIILEKYNALAEQTAHLNDLEASLYHWNAALKQEAEIYLQFGNRFSQLAEDLQETALTSKRITESIAMYSPSDWWQQTNALISLRETFNKWKTAVTYWETIIADLEHILNSQEAQFTAWEITFNKAPVTGLESAFHHEKPALWHKETLKTGQSIITDRKASLKQNKEFLSIIFDECLPQSNSSFTVIDTSFTVIDTFEACKKEKLQSLNPE